MSSVLDETSIRTSQPGLTQANGSRSLETGKTRSTKVDLRVDGTTSVVTSEERRRWRPATSTVRRRLLARYDGAEPWKHRNVRTHSRNWIRSGTRSQWRSWSSGVTCSDLLYSFQVAAEQHQWRCISNRRRKTVPCTRWSYSNWEGSITKRRVISGVIQQAMLVTASW